MPRSALKGPKSASTPAPARSRAKEIPQLSAVDAIRRAILSDELVPGQRLVEAELSKLLNASRGTVRAALMQLTHEGLIERIANKGARVRVVSLEEALQIVEVREAVEALCIRRAAERITPKQITALREMAKKLKDRADHGDVAEFADLTHEVFETYVQIAQQPVAQEILESLRARNTRHRFRLTYRSGRARIALPYWLAIIDSICRRDPDAAEAELHRHVKNVRENMMAIAKEHTPFAALSLGEETPESA